MVCPTLRQVMGYRLELEDAAASRAYGLQPNDIIIEIDGRWLLDVPDQHAELQRYAARPTIQLDLLVRFCLASLAHCLYQSTGLAGGCKGRHSIARARRTTNLCPSSNLRRSDVVARLRRPSCLQFVRGCAMMASM